MTFPVGNCYYAQYSQKFISQKKPNLRRKNYTPTRSGKLSAIAMAENESIALQEYLRTNRWLPHPDSYCERQREVALKTLQKVLCQWASSIQSLLPVNQNKWQRPRGKYMSNDFSTSCFSSCRSTPSCSPRGERILVYAGSDVTRKS
jgi:hypothetical protein